MAGITPEEDLIATLKLRGAKLVEPVGVASYRVVYGKSKIEFFIPQALESNGYTLDQLIHIEIALACYEIELLPIEYNLT